MKPVIVPAAGLSAQESVLCMKTLKATVNLPYDKIHSKYFFQKNTLFEV